MRDQQFTSAVLIFLMISLVFYPTICYKEAGPSKVGETGASAGSNP